MGAVARALLRRGVQAVLVVVLVSVLCFTLVRRLPGDQALRVAGGRYGYDRVTSATADAVRAELGLDRPAIEQFLAWVGRLAQGDLGASLVTGERVAVEIAHQLGHTLLLSLAALALALLAGPLLGFGPWHVLRRHVLPEMAPLFGTLAAFGFAGAVLAVGALGFIGIGMRPPTPEWGLMMVELLPYYDEAPLAMLAPAACLFALVLGLQLLAGRDPR